MGIIPNYRQKIFEEKYYPLKDFDSGLLTMSKRTGILMFYKSKFYKIYHIHGSGTIYTIIEGNELNADRGNLINIRKVDFEKHFFKMSEIRKQKLLKLNEKR